MLNFGRVHMDIIRYPGILYILGYPPSQYSSRPPGRPNSFSFFAQLQVTTESLQDLDVQVDALGSNQGGYSPNGC